MSTDQNHDTSAVYYMGLLPLIKYINENNVDTDKISKDEFVKIMKSFGKERGYEYQIFLDPYETHYKSIRFAMEKSEYLTAAVLTAITLEEDINGLIRLICFSKGYSHKNITQFISELGLKSKVDLVLPVLGCNVTEKYRGVVYQYFPLRNRIVHGKATPSLHTHEHDKDSDSESNMKVAEKLVKSYPIDKIYKYSLEINSSAIYDIPEIYRASKLLIKFGFKPKTEKYLKT